MTMNYSFPPARVAAPSRWSFHPALPGGNFIFAAGSEPHEQRRHSQAAAANSLAAALTCPHCWGVFPPEQALWIAQHPDLVGDARLGGDPAQRFLPNRFNLEGAAIDARGFSCHGLACPKCHLPVPRAMFEMEPVFLSILGAPACGKSYFLAAMTWQLRRILPKNFTMAFADADPIANHRLHEYEELQFLNPNPNALVAIQKTETQGDLYDTVLFGDQTINYPRPFMFTLQPAAEHPEPAFGPEAIARALSLRQRGRKLSCPGRYRG